VKVLSNWFGRIPALQDEADKDEADEKASKRMRAGICAGELPTERV